MTEAIKKKSQALMDDFHLHYFPHIPVDETADNDKRRASNSEFKRSQFHDIDPNPTCSTDLHTTAEKATPVAEPGPAIDNIKESAFQKGFLEGKKVGFETGSNKAQRVVESLQRVLEQFQNIRAEIHQELEKEVTHLALSIARKIVCHEIKTTRETVACVAGEALARVDNPGNIKIKLNPDDLQFIQSTQSHFTQFLQNFDHIDLEAQDSIQSGGCLIETDRGDIDARIEKQFEAIEEAFRVQFSQPKQESE
ncbi:MAG: FliH/SctL family protein [Desulfobacterales bacterium]